MSRLCLPLPNSVAPESPPNIGVRCWSLSIATPLAPLELRTGDPQDFVQILLVEKVHLRESDLPNDEDIRLTNAATTLWTFGRGMVAEPALRFSLAALLLQGPLDSYMLCIEMPVYLSMVRFTASNSYHAATVRALLFLRKKSMMNDP